MGAREQPFFGGGAEGREAPFRETFLGRWGPAGLFQSREVPFLQPCTVLHRMLYTVQPVHHVLFPLCRCGGSWTMPLRGSAPSADRWSFRALPSPSSQKRTRRKPCPGWCSHLWAKPEPAVYCTVIHRPQSLFPVLKKCYAVSWMV